ncbi:MAG: metal/formaldehyde-sensitive transcriptional repressor [Acidobacteriaceae bacterium]|nr:metal/formaldehyde-sensitive transcriptional repressor [Acidobacteriaceae bacterium]MBV9501503.1 metal/formaldehyde-sensitive transcriptional repressor [Acidobacteriaceae bacterium]
MAHISSDPDKKILARVRRIRGQIEGIERAIEGSSDCYAILQQTAAVRGALNGLVAELIEGHVRHHVLESSKNTRGAEELIDIVRSFLR